MKAKIISLLLVILLMSCATTQRKSYKPKYKKPDPNKPMPCPLKDC